MLKTKSRLNTKGHNQSMDTLAPGPLHRHSLLHLGRPGRLHPRRFIICALARCHQRPNRLHGNRTRTLRARLRSLRLHRHHRRGWRRWLSFHDLSGRYYAAYYHPTQSYLLLRNASGRKSHSANLFEWRVVYLQGQLYRLLLWGLLSGV